MQVYFKEDTLRFFHDLPIGEQGTDVADVSSRPDYIPTLGSPASCAFVHPCGDDMYFGGFRIVSEDLFEIAWHIEGPNKDGDIVQVYERAR